MMKKQALFILLFLLMSQVVHAADIALLKKRIEKQVESSGIKRSQLGLVVADEHGQIIYDLNATTPFVPASLTKIVTAAAVLEKLPVGHQFVTDVLVDLKKVKAGTLDGDICLRGGGDAGFVSESMWFLVNEFKRSGIQTIRGDLIVDDKRFDDIRFDTSRDQDRVDRAYDSPIGAMTFNWSAVNIFVRPGEKVGEPAQIFADPENTYLKIINSAVTAAEGKGPRIEVRNKGIKKDVEGEEIIVNGSIGINSPEFVAYKSITYPEIWAGVQFRQFLKQRSIQIEGRVRVGTCGGATRSVAQNKSRPVGELVTSMMKFSNNYIAEILTKNLGVELVGKPGTMEKGLKVIRDYLKELGVEGAIVMNPSGLSRKNKFRPQDLLTVLLKIKNNFRVYPEFLSSLPISGVDGTLKRRLGSESTGGQVRAKTGHLSGVTGLGGFVSGPEGSVYSFVFLFNGGTDDSYRSKDLFDKISIEILKP